jgi:capsular polysaccharide transport system permease protein
MSDTPTSPAADDAPRRTDPADASAASAETVPAAGQAPVPAPREGVDAAPVSAPLAAAPAPGQLARADPRRRSLETISALDAKKRRGFGVLGSGLFWLTVLLPTLASLVYFGWLASDVYISESRFVVRTPQRSPQPGLLGSLLQGGSFARAQDDAFTVHDFVLSRDALRELDAKRKLRPAFSDEAVDPLSRFPGPFGDPSFESLFKFYQKHVKLEYDTVSSITTLRVSAFSPELARDVNADLLAMGERLVNQINERGRDDLIKFAAAEAAEAEAKAKAAAAAVANFRNQRGVFDPERQSAMQLQQVSKLQDELIATKLQLAQIQALSPQNPQIATLQKRAAGLQAEMEQEMAKVAGSGGNNFSNKASEFERLTLERAFADRQMASALTSLENARNEARRQQLYLERIVQPNLPDYALEPRRVRNIVATFVLGLVAWGVLTMLLSGVKEHQA